MFRPGNPPFRLILVTVALAAALTVAPAAAQAAGQLDVSPAQLDFRTTTVSDQAAHQQVTVKNGGDAPVSIGNVYVDGSNPSDFNVNGNCGGQLDPGQVAGSTSSSPREAPAPARRPCCLLGRPARRPDGRADRHRADPELSFEPSSYDFGVQYVNRGSTQATLTLRNTGDAAVQVNSVDITGPGSGAFWTVSSAATAPRSSRMTPAAFRCGSARATPWILRRRCAPGPTAPHSPPI